MYDSRRPLFPYFILLLLTLPWSKDPSSCRLWTPPARSPKHRGYWSSRLGSILEGTLVHLYIYARITVPPPEATDGSSHGGIPGFPGIILTPVHLVAPRVCLNPVPLRQPRVSTRTHPNT
ncbi:hypothetical protein EDB85DRAFT_644644 [Lactarius pseudohatsudake]|nr:hypothetical protein EDB85DRAFT_644644 [Lactarius pseudohatsudake]